MNNSTETARTQDLSEVLHTGLSKENHCSDSTTTSKIFP